MWFVTLAVYWAYKLKDLDFEDIVGRVVHRGHGGDSGRLERMLTKLALFSNHQGITSSKSGSQKV